MRLAIDVHFMRLYNGRRSVWAAVTIGRRTWFLSRWDTVRVLPKPGNRDLHRGPVMTWYVGGF